MGILSHLFCIDINRGVRNYQATPGAVLLDVRSRESYARKRIPESRNLPLEELSRAKEVLPDLSVPSLFTLMGERPVPGPSPG